MFCDEQQKQQCEQVNEGEKRSCYARKSEGVNALVQSLKGTEEVEPDGGIVVVFIVGVYVFPVNNEFGDPLHVLYVIVAVQH